MRHTYHLLPLLFRAALGMATPNAHATQKYSAKPIRLISIFALGSGAI